MKKRENMALKNTSDQVCYLIPLIQALGKLKQENCREFVPGLAYIVRFCFKSQNKKYKKKHQVGYANLKSKHLGGRGKKLTKFEASLGHMSSSRLV